MSPNEPRTNNPGLGNYIGRTAGVAVYLAIILAFTAVHFFYATSALLDLLAVFILFVFLFFLGLSLTCLVLCARVGPGDLPSRFSAARMETFIRAELQRIVAKARPAAPPATAERAKSASESEKPLDGAATATVVPKPQQRWADIDAAEAQQLANSASLAAMAERASPTAAAAEWERAASEARLRVQEERIDLSSSDAEGDEEGHDEERRKRRQRRRRRQQQQHGSTQEGDGVVQEDGSIANSADEEPEVQELPAYMPEMMRLRRLRKLRRGLDVVRVSDAARKVLEALDSDDFDRKREEMGYLIPGANWCRFCSFYQMNDTRHCTVCCRCVYRTKLHCVCCGSCIGYANSKYYVLFLFYFVLAFLMANFLDLYCINTGYTYFFKASGESNSVYYLVFVYSYSVVVLAFSLLVQYLLAAGRNVGLLTELLREQREELESVQARNSGELYQPVLSERTADIHDDGNSSPDQAREPFSWQRAMNTVGEGLPLPMWFWPVPTRPAVKEMDDPEGFWTSLTEAIRIRLRSVADEDDAFTDEDEAVESRHDNDAGDADVRVQPAFAAVAAATAAAPRLPPAPMPHRAKSSDVTVVLVPPPAEADADVTVASTAEDRQTPTPVSAVTPPIAKAAPALRVKKD